MRFRIIRRSRPGLVLIIAILTTSSGGAAEEPPGVFGTTLLPGDGRIGPAASVQETPVIARGGDQILAVWTDSRTNFVSLPPFTEDEGARDLYAARLDGAGNLLDTVPIVVNQDFGYQRNPAVSWNGQSWLVVWENQSPTQSYYASEILATRIGPDGSVLDASPISIVAYQSSSSAMHAVTSSGTDWLVVAQGTSAGEDGILGVRVAADGSVLDPSPRVLVPSTYFLYFDITVHSAENEYLLVYKASSENLASRFDLDLNPVGIDPIPVPGLLASSSGADYYVVWNSGTNLVGSPMSLDGTLELPGGAFLVAASGITATDLVWDGSGHWWVSWQHAVRGLEATRIDSAGSVLDPGGVSLDPSVEEFVAQHRIAGRPSGGIELVWKDRRALGSYPDDIYASYFTADADPGIETCISLGAPAQLGSDICEGPGGYLVAFNSWVSGERRILVQRVDGIGAPIDTEPIEIASGSSLSNPGVDWNGEVFLVTWSDGATVLGRRLDADSVPIDPDPIPLMPGYTTDTAALGSRFLVVGTYQTTSIQFVYPFAVRFDGQTGSVLDPSPILLGQSFARSPQVVPFGNRWLAVWQRNFSHDDTQATTRGAFIDPDGVSPGEFNVSYDIGISPAVAAAGDTALVAWRSGTLATANNDIRAARLLSDGTLLDGTYGFTISSATDKQSNPTIGWNGSEFVVAWEDKRNAEFFFDERTDIYGARLDPAGTLLDPDGFEIAADPLPETMPAIAGGNGYVLLAASRFRDTAPYASYRLGVQMVGLPETVGIPGGYDRATFVDVPRPNPFRHSTTIHIRLADPTSLSLAIFDTGGKRVKDLYRGPVGAGEFAWGWDGQDDRGRQLAPGLYYFRIRMAGTEVRRSAILIR